MTFIVARLPPLPRKKPQAGCQPGYELLLPLPTGFVYFLLGFFRECQFWAIFLRMAVIEFTAMVG